MDWTNCPDVEFDLQKLGGVPVVKGTRVQADAIIENYDSGSDLEEIHENFPSVSMGRIQAVLSFAEALREQPQL